LNLDGAIEAVAAPLRGIKRRLRFARLTRRRAPTADSAARDDQRPRAPLYAARSMSRQRNIMSEHSDKRLPKGHKPPADKAVQGEGDYEAARRYRKEVTEFISKSDVDALAREATPASAKEARDLALAEERGRDRSKGDDAADPGIMYPGRKPDAER
jgi:hypothetical protein